MTLYTKIKAYSLAAMILIGGIMTSCEDDINIGKESENKYTTKGIGVFAVNQNGKKDIGTFEFREEGTAKLTLKLNEAVSEKLEAIFKYDSSILDRYNKENESTYEIFPEELVSIVNGEKITIEAGGKSSTEVDFKIKSNGKLESNKSYVIPVKISISSNNEEIENKDTNYLIFVKDMTGIPSAEKYAVGDDGVSRRVEIISCMEMGDTNPLNNLSFTLKNSGRPLVDILVMFSGNIKYNDEEGKVYLSLNKEIQHVLDNSDTYLKPLRDRGIKIVMSIMPHHDRASLTNLTTETAKQFVQDLKIFFDAHNIDGAFWDEEYSGWGAPSFNTYPDLPGFVEFGKSPETLIYEFNRAMPDKLSIVYAYSKLYRLNSHNEVPSGKYITHAVNDYPDRGGMQTRFPELPDSGSGIYSQEYNDKRGIITNPNSSELKTSRNKGYCHMIFAMNPYRSSYAGYQLPSMKALAKALFDDDIEVGDFYKKDY